MQALFLEHCTKPGRRDELEAAWRRHMMPAISTNDGHLAYLYGFGADPDTVVAFQLYRSEEDANAFMQSPAYLAYLAESRPLLQHDPEIARFEPRWIKGV